MFRVTGILGMYQVLFHPGQVELKKGTSLLEKRRPTNSTSIIPSKNSAMCVYYS
jgi:hypothetical protein